jgi:hypothetical protein
MTGFGLRHLIRFYADGQQAGIAVGSELTSRHDAGIVLGD